MSNPNYMVARNAMLLIKNGAASDAFEALGISTIDFELCCGDSPWIGADRGRICSILSMLTHGTLDVVALPRIEVPAEFMAGVISTFVAPGNLGVACRWMEAGDTAESIASGGSLEAVTAARLFALCCMLAADAPAAQAAWRKRTGRAVRLASESGQEVNDGLSQ